MLINQSIWPQTESNNIVLFHSHNCHINPLPDDKILDWSKLKLIADNILKRI